MSKLRNKLSHAREVRGFTLVELLVVVAILGLLAAIAIPTMLGQRSKAQDADAKSSVRSTLETLMATRDDTAGDWSPVALDDSEKIKVLVADAEGAYTFTAATADGTPASEGPQDVIVRRVDASNVTLSAKSSSGTFFCVQAVSNGPAVYASSTVAVTCDGGTGGW